MSSVILAFTIREYTANSRVTRIEYQSDKQDHVISADMMQDLEDRAGYECASENEQNDPKPLKPLKPLKSQKSMPSKSGSKSGRKGQSGRMVWRKKKTPNIIQRNKSQKYTKIPASSPKSIFGNTSTERNELRQSAIPGPGAYAEDWANTLVTSPKLKSPRISGTFGSAKKLISTECAKTDKLGPGCYDCIDSYESPRRKVNGLGSTWGKAPRPVVDTIDTATKKETVSNVQVETAAAGTGMGSAMSTEKDLDEAHFDWKWYRTQYHEMVMHKDNALKSPLRSSIISNKFVAIAQSPTHNKSSHHFGASPRFKDLNTDPAMLSSFKGCRPTSVKQILS